MEPKDKRQLPQELSEEEEIKKWAAKLPNNCISAWETRSRAAMENGADNKVEKDR